MSRSVSAVLGLLLAVLAAGTAGAAPQPRAAGSAAAAAVAVTPGVSVVRLVDGSQRAYGVDARGVVYEQRSSADGRTWSGRKALGAGLRSAPAAVYSAALHRIDLFVVDSAGRLLTRTQSGGGWGPWSTVPVSGFVGALTGARTVNGGLLLLGRDAAGRVIGVINTRQSGWRPAGTFGRGMRGDVALVVSGRDRMDLFGVDGSGRVVHATGAAGRIGGWVPISRSGFSGGVAAAVSSAGVWRVIARGTDGRPYAFLHAGSGWRGPTPLGGTVAGVPGALLTTPAGVGRFFAVMGGTIAVREAGTSCCGWRALTAPPPPQTGPQLAAALLARWGGRLSGTSGVLADLRAEAAGRAITTCGTRVRLDAAMLRMVLATTDRYQVFLYTMVTGHSCDSGYHPRGMAVDFNTVVDPSTGARTNWHTGTSGDNRALDAAFLTYAAARITSGGGAGQAQCAGSAAARLPAGMLRFADACTHQHLDTRR